MKNGTLFRKEGKRWLKFCEVKKIDLKAELKSSGEMIPYEFLLTCVHGDADKIWRVMESGTAANEFRLRLPGTNYRQWTFRARVPDFTPHSQTLRGKIRFTYRLRIDGKARLHERKTRRKKA